MKGAKEKNFEDAIEQSLLGRGYDTSAANSFSPELGLNTDELIAFVAVTQGDRWAQLVSRYGGHEDEARAGFARRVSDEIGRRGLLDVLRGTVKDKMLEFSLAYFKPATSMNATHAERYAANRLAITRQLRYSGKHANTIDLGLLLNGLLVATAELKNPFTDQTVDHAMAQYKADRDGNDPVLRRVLVHFAVDPYLVYMTTKLAGNATMFLPFNQGRDGGKGNPDAPGYATAYLWEQVWEREAWLDILQRFVQTSGPAKNVEITFPRYHQWHAVRSLEAHARQNGAGQLYLIQHSAGSGKTKSISWLAHRLSTLHNALDDKVFDKVIVITDRRVLDEQLRGQVAAFEKVKGTVASILGNDGSKSGELARALADPAVKIVVTTLQVFPFLLAGDQAPELDGQRFAVIVDEAHSSQTGDAAAALRQTLGAGGGEDGDAEDALNALVSARGHQANLSFFAFTATPKDKTIELFGSPQADGTKGPFDLYSMRQAIEEGFILDVLEHYLPYKTYFKLAVTSDAAGTKEVEVSKASAELRRMVVTDPDVIVQKARIIVEHYRVHTARKVAGLGKAMVVTDSRAAAVKYKRAIDAYIDEQGYQDLRTLVAFSGTVNDDIQGPVTESSLNDFPDTQTGNRFKGVDPFKPGDYQVLIVAEKFQTGFDEPRLHTMFVDKVLTGLNTVQTLSRLNRTHPDKTDTFVLDFRNDPDSVRADFQRWYERTTTNPTDVNAITDAHDRLMSLGILGADEMRAVIDQHFATNDTPAGLGSLYAAFNPCLDRFGAASVEDQAEFRTVLDAYVRLYSFMSQVLTWTDVDLEVAYLFGRAVQRLLPKESTGQLQLGDDVVLTHLRLVAREELGIGLEEGDVAPGTAFPGAGQGKLFDSKFETLAQITDELNKAFGTDLGDRDRLTFEQFEVTWLADPELRDIARSNDLDGFGLEFERIFKGTILANEAANQDLYERIYTDPEFARTVLGFYRRRIYDLLRSSPTTTGHDVGRQSRSDAAKAARATSLLEGVTLDDAGTAVLERWVGGELDDEQLVDEMGRLPLP